MEAFMNKNVLHIVEQKLTMSLERWATGDGCPET